MEGPIAAARDRAVEILRACRARSVRSWKSKLKSVSGETGTIFAPSMEPSGFNAKVT